jgi:hypothetical protein
LTGDRAQAVFNGFLKGSLLTGLDADVGDF